MEGYQKACGVAQSLGLPPQHFLLHFVEGENHGDAAAHKFLQQCQKTGEEIVSILSEPRLPSTDQDSLGSASLLVNCLTDLTNQVMNSLDFNTVLSCVLEGLHRAVGFDHAIVLLMVPGKSLAVGRYGVGPNVSPTLLWRRIWIKT